MGVECGNSAFERGRLLLLLLSCSITSDSLWPCGLQHASLPCSSLSPRICSNLCPSSWWCHPTISSSVVPSPPALNLSQHQGLFQWVCPSHQVAKVLELQLHHQSFQWIYSGLISFRINWCLISLLSKGLSRVFSSTTVWKDPFFSAQPSLWSEPHICTGFPPHCTMDFAAHITFHSLLCGCCCVWKEDGPTVVEVRISGLPTHLLGHPRLPVSWPP